MALLAVAMACRPEEQKRLMVCAETHSGSSARLTMRREAFMLISLVGEAQPVITSSMSAGSSWGIFANTPFKVWAAYSMGCIWASPPLRARQQGLRP